MRLGGFYLHVMRGMQRTRSLNEPYVQLTGAADGASVQVCHRTDLGTLTSHRCETSADKRNVYTDLISSASVASNPVFL